MPVTEQPEHGPTILVVDDEPGVRLLAKVMLNKSGYRVVEASNGREAVEVFADQSDRIDVVLLDVMMPVVTGHEAIVELRRMDPTLPIVFFSGYDESEVAEHLADPPAPTLFLAKPFTKDELAERIATALESRARSEHSG